MQYQYTGSGWLEMAWRTLEHETYHAARAERLERAGQAESAERARGHAAAIREEGSHDLTAYISRYRAVMRPRS